MKFCPFSQFRDIFGKPGIGVHKYKIMGTAIVDYVLTLVLALVWTYFTGFPLVLSTIMMFVIGIVCHILFGVPTDAVKYLGLKC